MARSLTASQFSDTYQFGFHAPEEYVFKTGRGLSAEVVKEISAQKKEPNWMKELRLEALSTFRRKPMPAWGADLSGIDFDNIYYYLRPTDKVGRTWQEVPTAIKNTYDKLGIPQAEREFLAGVKAQWDSEIIYSSLLETLRKKGVIFLSMDQGLREHEDLVRQYFGKLIPATDNKFSALNSAVWSGGSFIYVPKGVKVELPLQAYFRINAVNMGQFERTLIIADEGSYLSYLEGCSAPVYSRDALHAAVVEIFVKKGARVRYTTIQNWSNDVYNLVTKRMRVEEEGVGEWIDCNLGCLAAETKIFSNSCGPVSISKLQKDDWIYGLDLNSFLPVRQKVVAVQPTGKKLLYQVTTRSYREIKATTNHLFLTLQKKNIDNMFIVSWQPLEKLKAGDLIAVSDYLPNDGKSKVINYTYPYLEGSRLKIKVRLPRETSDGLMWFLGLYLGDGCIELSKSRRPRRVYFAVPERDRARARLLRVIKNLFRTRWRPKGLCVTIGSSLLADFILSLGFDGTAKTKHIPTWVWSLPLSQKLSFIEGYFDADGHTRKKKIIDRVQYGQITFASANKRLLEQLKLLMITCGLKPLKISTYTSARKLYQGREKVYTTYYLTLNIRDNLEIIRQKKHQVQGIRFERIRFIKPLSEAVVYDIEIENGHNFIANGLVVHNSKITMKYPSVYLFGRKAHGEILSMAAAGFGQHLDAGGKMVHLNNETTSKIINKSISRLGGRTSYRGLLKVIKGLKGIKAKVVCDALILDEKSRSDTYPLMQIDSRDAIIEHEATVSKIGARQLFYLMSRGLSEEQASDLILNGFIEPIVKQLPLEYAVEMNRLIELNMEGSVG